MNILITGIHGFIGSNLVAALKVQHNLYGIDIISPENEGVQKTYEWNELDQIPPVDVIIHLAGKAHDTKNTSSATDYFDINVGLTRKIFQYFNHSEATKFIFFSSVKAVADCVRGNELTEEDIPDPQTPYGQSKLAAEQYIESRKSEVGSQKSEDGSSQSPNLEPGTWNLEHELRKAQPDSSLSQSSPDSGLRSSVDPLLPSILFATQGALAELPTSDCGLRSSVSVFILRPCMIHGPGNKGNLNLLYRMVQKGLPWPLGAYENQRSFTSIDNLNYIIGQLIERDIEPGIYQVADDEALSTNELFGLIAQSQNRKARIWNISEKQIRLLARIGDYLHLPLNSERLQKLTESYKVSNLKIKKALGIEKMPVSATQGLQKTLESFKG